EHYTYRKNHKQETGFAVEASVNVNLKWAPLQSGAIVAIVVIAVLTLAGTQLRAQTSNAQVSGVVADTSGAVVGGAQITAVNRATNVPYRAVSNGQGVYVLPELLPGPYTLTVRAQGFGT